MKWVDGTSYSRGDTERKQRSWTAKFGKELNITVLNNHIYYPGRFILHCAEVCIACMPLPEGITPEQAQDIGVAKVQAKLEAMRSALLGDKEHG